MQSETPRGRRMTREEFVPLWNALRDRVIAYLESFGKQIDPFGHKDFWVVDDDLNIALVQVEIYDLALLQPQVIYGLRDIAADNPRFLITVAVVAPVGVDWPRMGLTLGRGEIVDGLKRSYLPPAYSNLFYHGSRPD